jgi:Rps23 Pro-64 3,4-dihydroxylase Tpa1-like proline 4-hydroxylase
MEEELNATVCENPFPHLIIENFYNEDELELIWQELNFYTLPNKLLSAKKFGGVVGKTESKGIILDNLYKNYKDIDINYRDISNILTVNRKLFNSGVLDVFADIHDCCSIASKSNNDITKIRYYHDGEGYEPHTDKGFHFLAFSYFYREPKKFTGGELFFPKYDYEVPCDNNSMIIFPGWVEHGVREVSISDSEYFEGYGRYAITSFFGCNPPSV